MNHVLGLLSHFMVLIVLLILLFCSMFAKIHHWCGDGAYCGVLSFCNDCANCTIFNHHICGIAETETDIFYLDFCWNDRLDYSVCVPMPDPDSYPSPFNYEASRRVNS